MRAQFFLFSFGVPSANEFLDFFSHSMLLIWESALLASCYKLSIVSLAKSPWLPASARMYSMGSRRRSATLWRPRPHLRGRVPVRPLRQRLVSVETLGPMANMAAAD